MAQVGDSSCSCYGPMYILQRILAFPPTCLLCYALFTKKLLMSFNFKIAVVKCLNLIMFQICNVRIILLNPLWIHTSTMWELLVSWCLIMGFLKNTGLTSLFNLENMLNNEISTMLFKTKNMGHWIIGMVPWLRIWIQSVLLFCISNFHPC